MWGLIEFILTWRDYFGWGEVLIDKIAFNVCARRKWRRLKLFVLFVLCFCGIAVLIEFLFLWWNRSKRVIILLAIHSLFNFWLLFEYFLNFWYLILLLVIDWLLIFDYFLYLWYCFGNWRLWFLMFGFLVNDNVFCFIEVWLEIIWFRLLNKVYEMFCDHKLMICRGSFMQISFLVLQIFKF